MRKLLRQLWSIQILRFLLVGGVNTVFGYTVFISLILLDLHFVVAVLLSQTCGILFNFKTTGVIVFKNKDNHLLFRFFGVYVLTYFLNIGFLKVCGLSNLIGEAIIILPLALLTYWLQKRYVFREATE